MVFACSAIGNVAGKQWRQDARSAVYCMTLLSKQTPLAPMASGLHRLIVGQQVLVGLCRANTQTAANGLPPVLNVPSKYVHSQDRTFNL
jgi:hypothetical protein